MKNGVNTASAQPNSSNRKVPSGACAIRKSSSRRYCLSKVSCCALRRAGSRFFSKA